MMTAGVHRQDGEGLRNAILQIVPLLDEADPAWCIYGSMALVLNGVAGMEAHDVDILMSADGVHRLMQRLPQARLLTDDKPDGRFRSLHARIYIKGVEVDVSGDLLVRQAEEWQAVHVHTVCQRQGIRYASLPDCIRLLRQFARPKDLLRLEQLGSVE